MKNITLPKELLNLPQPWANTHPRQRREALRSLSYEFSSSKTALNVLERCLHTLSELTLSNSDVIPEELYELWSFSVEWLAETIPTFEEFDLVKIKQFLITEEGFDSPSPELIRAVADYWIWWVTWDIERAALYWIQHALQATRNPILISRFLHIASRYWHKLSPDFAQSLLSASAMIGRQKAFPLLESVAQHPNASEAVKETARDYRQFVYKYPEKWLPDSEALEEMSANKNEQMVRRITQPALPQLAYLS